MQNIRIVISYKGTNYSGWQRQTRIQKGTIQGILEEALGKITRERIKVLGAGRTDAGVHALGQVANFKARNKMTPEEFKKALNSILPRDIVIKNSQRVKENFHAQFEAKSKRYKYIIYQDSQPSPFLRDYALYIPYKLNLRAMKEGARYLKGKHDFSSFRLSGSSIKNSTRTIIKLSVTSHRSYRIPITDYRSSGSRLISINCVADGFLYGMVRSMVGTLLEVGRGKIGPGRVKEILKAGNRRSAGPTSPARGLYLVNVKY